MARKSTIKETLINSYTENTDYILKNIRKGNNGRPSHDIIISFDCMKKLCMTSRSKNGDTLRTYFINLEKCINTYSNNLFIILKKHT